MFKRSVSCLDTIQSYQLIANYNITGEQHNKSEEREWRNITRNKDLKMFLVRYVFLVILLFLGLNSTAYAQTISSADDSSHIRERFTKPPVPLAQPEAPSIHLESTAPPEQAASTRLTIEKITVEGSTVYPPSDFDALAADIVGHEVSLEAVYDLAAKITAKYGADGYVLSRAIVPPQQMQQSGAVIRLRVIEGYIDHVEWPESVNRYRDFFTHYAEEITSERPANIKTIERYLLLANDLPGLTFKSTMKPSDNKTGATTLVLEMDDKPVSAQLHSDNRGTSGRGPDQVNSSVAFNNLLGLHESMGVTLATVPDVNQLYYGAVDLKTVLNSEGLAFTFDPYYSGGKPGTASLNAIDYRSTSYGFESGLSYPFIRSREQNLTLSGLVFLTDSNGDINAGALSRDRLRGVRLRTIYDVADQLNGINQAIGTFSQGIDGLGSTHNGYALASRTAGHVNFSKFELSLNRTQPLPRGFSLYGGAEGQLSLDALQPTEQCTFGGDRLGRAYDPSSFVGDRCLAETAELRFDIPHNVPKVTQAQVYTYADHGDVWVMQAAAGTAAYSEGSSAGAGLRVGLMNTVSASGEIGERLDGTSPHDLRVFFAATIQY